MGSVLPDVVVERGFVLVLKCCQNNKGSLKSRMKPSFFFIYLNIYTIYSI